MLSSMSSKAILAKARTMYGKRLTDKDYDELLACRTVSDVASYLKNRTSYSDILSGLNENDVHRGQLEELLKKKLFYNISSLGRFDMNSEKFLTQYYIAQTEVEQIMRCVTLLGIGRANEYAFEMPIFFDKHTKIRLKDFSSVQSYRELADVLDNTKYSKILLKALPEKDEKPNLPKIETALYTHIFNVLFESISAHTKGKEKKELLDLFYALIDFKNFTRIFRLKISYKQSPQTIKELLIPFGRASASVMDKMCNASDENELITILKSTYIGKSLAELEFSNRSQMYTALKFKYSKHHIRLSPYPSVVMLSYMILTEIELSNIINLIEGARYGISQEEKARLLVR